MSDDCAWRRTCKLAFFVFPQGETLTKSASGFVAGPDYDGGLTFNFFLKWVLIRRISDFFLGRYLCSIGY